MIEQISVRVATIFSVLDLTDVYLSIRLLTLMVPEIESNAGKIAGN